MHTLRTILAQVSVSSVTPHHFVGGTLLSSPYDVMCGRGPAILRYLIWMTQIMSNVSSGINTKGLWLLFSPPTQYDHGEVFF